MNFVFEIYSDEIPYIYQAKILEKARKEFCNIFSDFVTREDRVETYVTCCRVAVVSELHGSITTESVKIKGPPIQAAQIALDGFLRKNSILSLSDLTQENGFYFYETPKRQIFLQDALEKKLNEFVDSLSSIFDSAVAWQDTGIKWTRQVHNILCIFSNIEGASTPLRDIKIGNLLASKRTFGHQYSNGYAIEITSAKDYEQTLLNNGVIVSGEKRQAIIKNYASDAILQLQRNEQHSGGCFTDKFLTKQLLEELSCLSEYPHCILNEICVNSSEADDKLSFSHSAPLPPAPLPFKIAELVLKVNQRHVLLNDLEETQDINNINLYYVIVADGLIDCKSEAGVKKIENIKDGNNLVVRARLQDAQFLCLQDLQMLAKEEGSNFSALEQLVFHEKFGSYSLYCKYLNKLLLKLNVKNLPLNMAELLKFDLITNVVQDFTELQGFYGSYILSKKLGVGAVSESIKHQYFPQKDGGEFVGHRLDGIDYSSVLQVNVLEKLLSMAILMLCGEKATSSRDPFAIRRKAIGVLRAFLEHGHEIGFSFTQAIDALFSLGLSFEGTDRKNTILNIKEEMVRFFEERLVIYLQTKYQFSDKVFDYLRKNYLNKDQPTQSYGTFCEFGISEVVEEAKAISAQLNNKDFLCIALATARIANLLSASKFISSVKKDTNESAVNLLNSVLSSRFMSNFTSKNQQDLFLAVVSFKSWCAENYRGNNCGTINESAIQALSAVARTADFYLNSEQIITTNTAETRQNLGFISCVRDILCIFNDFSTFA